MTTVVFGESRLNPTNLRPRQSTSVTFTPQEGVIQVNAGGVELGGGRPTGRPVRAVGARAKGDGPSVPEGPGREPGDIVIRQNVTVTAGLWPPGASRARKTKTFRIRDLDRTINEPLELGVLAEDAGKPWKCVFTNAGRTEARVFGGVKFVKERHEDPSKPDEVSEDSHTEWPLFLLKPKQGAIRSFVPAEGLIEVYVFAVESHSDKPSGKIDDFPQEGDDDDLFQFPQDVRVRVELRPAGSGVVSSGEFRLHTTRRPRPEDRIPRSAIRTSVSEDLAGQEWQVRFVNAGNTSVICFGRVNHQGQSVRTELPLRLLNHGLRQLIAALGLTVRLDGKKAYIGVSDELAEFATQSLGGSLDAPIDLQADVSDVNLSSFGVYARTDTGRPVISAFARFETDGQEVNNLYAVVDVDIDRLAFTLDLEFSTAEVTEVTAEGPRTRWELRPVVTAKVDVSAWGEVLDTVGADVSDMVLGKINPKLQEVAHSAALRDAITAYLTQGLVDLARQGNAFRDLIVEPARFVVLSMDPSPGEPPEPDQPKEVSFPRPSGQRPRRADAASQANLKKIEQIVVLMQENRSFDHMLGYLSHPDHGLPRPGGDPSREVPDGLDGTETNPLTGGGTVRVAPYPVGATDYGEGDWHLILPATAMPFGPHHEYDHVKAQIGKDGAMLGFADDFRERFPRADSQWVMRFYTDEHLPVFAELASTYTICDRWFCSHPGPTQPNRFCTLSGHTPVLDNFDVGDPIVGYLRMPTLFDVLTAAGIDWIYYEDDVGFLRVYDQYRLDDRHVIPFDDRDEGFLRRADLGSLPPVTFIDPNFTDVPPVATANDDHAPADLNHGQQLIKKIHDALVTSVQWKSTLFVITYDEHGGFFDHVPPPGTKQSEQPRTLTRVHPTGPTFYGPRVPTFVISPFVQAGKVSHTVFDHTSIMATILRRFVGRIPPQLGPRPAAANDLGRLLDLDKPRTGRKLSAAPGPVVSRRAIDTRDDPQDFHASMRALAQPKPRRR